MRKKSNSNPDPNEILKESSVILASKTGRKVLNPERNLKNKVVNNTGLTIYIRTQKRVNPFK